MRVEESLDGGGVHEAFEGEVDEFETLGQEGGVGGGVEGVVRVLR